MRTKPPFPQATRWPSIASSFPGSSPKPSPPSPTFASSAKKSRASQPDPAYALTILATGPLTSDALSREIERLTGSGHLAFYDSISPIVDAESIDMNRVYMAARWDKGTADYINCPMDREEFDRFLDALLAAEAAEAKEWEKLDYFEGCLPIEVLARRGRDTLRFGPMKPVGLRDPRTGKTPWAVVQLRKENLRADSYNLVGFQNHLKFGEQARVLRLIPGLENARFLRYGQIHRNTYICAPAPARRDPPPEDKDRRQPHPLRRPALRRRRLHRIHRHRPAGRHLRGAIVRGEEPMPVPRATALGSLVHYITHADPKDFQPANITFDLLEPLEEELRKKVRDKKERHRIVVRARPGRLRRLVGRAIPHPAAELPA